MRRPKSMEGYVPLTWDADSVLDPHEQDNIEQQRRDLWRAGIREPNLTRMAFEFGAVITMLQNPGDEPRASSNPDEATAGDRPPADG